jgi:hypothetical protein
MTWVRIKEKLDNSGWWDTATVVIPMVILVVVGIGLAAWVLWAALSQFHI